MQFYLCSKPGGATELAGTQADAKAIDRGFKPVDVPTDKAGLMSYVNDLLAKINLFPPVAIPPLADFPAEAQELIKHGPRTSGPITIVKDEAMPHPMKRWPTAHPLIQEIWTRDECERAIETMDFPSIRKLEEIINARKGELHAADRKRLQQVAAPAPRARTRKPV